MKIHCNDILTNLSCRSLPRNALHSDLCPLLCSCVVGGHARGVMVVRVDGVRGEDVTGLRGEDVTGVRGEDVTGVRGEDVTGVEERREV